MAIVIEKQPSEGVRIVSETDSSGHTSYYVKFKVRLLFGLIKTWFYVTTDFGDLKICRNFYSVERAEKWIEQNLKEYHGNFDPTI